MPSANTFTVPFTRTVTSGSFTVISAMGLTKITVLNASGTVTILGGKSIPDGSGGSIASSAISLPELVGMTFTNEGNSSQILDGITINAGSGTALIMGW